MRSVWLNERSRKFQATFSPGAWLLLLALLPTACSSSQSLRLARQADYIGVRRALQDEPLKDQKDAFELSKAVLSAEIDRAKGINDRRFIRSLRRCSASLEEALEARAHKKDALGAEAAVLLTERDRFPGNPNALRTSKDGAWRAVAARATDTEDATSVRHEFFEDDDQRVRRAALDAALELRSEEDVEPLLEVSRLDPDPLSRSKAFMALGSIGTKRVLLALKDRFVAADEAGRLAIVDAYGRSGLRPIGGEAQLEKIVDEESGFVGLHAAHALASSAQEQRREKARAKLVEFARHGTVGERRLALRRLPADHPLTEDVLLASTKNADPDVGVIAWARLLGRPQHRQQAEKQLLAIALSEQPQAYEARAALSAAGTRRALPLLSKQAKAPQPDVRRVAGRGLLRLESWEALGPLLVDESEQVRRSLTCRVLSAKRSR